MTTDQDSSAQNEQSAVDLKKAFDELNQGERTADAMEDHLDAIEAKIRTMLEDAKAAGVDLGDLDSKATDGDQRDSQTG